MWEYRGHPLFSEIMTVQGINPLQSMSLPLLERGFYLIEIFDISRVQARPGEFFVSLEDSGAMGNAHKAPMGFPTRWLVHVANENHNHSLVLKRVLDMPRDAEWNFAVGVWTMVKEGGPL